MGGGEGEEGGTSGGGSVFFWPVGVFPCRALWALWRSKMGGTMSNLEDVSLKYVESKLFVLVWGDIVVKWERRGGSGWSEKRSRKARVMMRVVVALKLSAVG